MERCSCRSRSLNGTRSRGMSSSSRPARTTKAEKRRSAGLSRTISTARRLKRASRKPRRIRAFRRGRRWKSPAFLLCAGACLIALLIGISVYFHQTPQAPAARKGALRETSGTGRSVREKDRIVCAHSSFSDHADGETGARMVRPPATDRSPSDENRPVITSARHTGPRHASRARLFPIDTAPGAPSGAPCTQGPIAPPRSRSAPNGCAPSRGRARGRLRSPRGAEGGRRCGS